MAPYLSICMSELYACIVWAKNGTLFPSFLSCIPVGINNDKYVITW